MKAQIASDHKNEYFAAGLDALGYEVSEADNHEPGKDDVLVVWNRKPSNIDRVKRFEHAGARVIVAENGYIGTDRAGERLISLALSHHLGKGRWHVGTEPRWQQHNFRIWPWRAPGEEVVILAQRGIGESTDLTWAEDLAAKLQKETKRRVRVRAHPGKNPPPVEDDLLDAHCVVTYASAAAIKAIAFGVPAFYLMPEWVGAPAASFGTDIEHPYRSDRTPMFHRMGWAQWTAKEVSTGKAFEGLLKL